MLLDIFIFVNFLLRVGKLWASEGSRNLDEAEAGGNVTSHVWRLKIQILTSCMYGGSKDSKIWLKQRSTLPQFQEAIFWEWSDKVRVRVMGQANHVFLVNVQRSFQFSYKILARNFDFFSAHLKA